jgi:lauroyl/myristoyl acyltransferase
MKTFARRYLFFLQFLRFWNSFAPLRWRPYVLLLAARWLSPFRPRSASIRRAMKLAIPAIDDLHIWHEWLDSHLKFVLHFFQYSAVDTSWLSSEVRVMNPDVVTELRNSGGLVLTFHTHHQNTLCCFLGNAGIKVSAIAAPPEGSPLFPYMGYWMKRVNADSERHFLAGTYIFTSHLRKLLRSTQKLLVAREAVVCLCDFHQAGENDQPSACFFDRRVTPPTGVIKIALENSAPVFVAMLAPYKNLLCLQLQRLDGSHGLQHVIQEYFSFLEINIRKNPACWEGWDWFENFPFTDTPEL